MSLAETFFRPEDEAHIIGLRREIHAHPELGFDLPNTVAIVRRELDSLNIPYRLDYAPGSVAAIINPDCAGPTIGLRADMDALPMEEKTGAPYASTIPNRMHSCGHDAHTAMLLGAARALKRAALACWVISGGAFVRLVLWLWVERGPAPLFTYNALFIPAFFMAGLLFMVMSALFRQAAELKEDQDLTI